MADGKRTAIIIMLAFAVLAGLGTELLPLGDAFWDPPANGGMDERIDEQYSLWTLDQDISRVGASDESNDNHWFAESLDGTGGITLLRAAPVVFTIALVSALVALILVLPDTGNLRRIAGVFALFAAIMGAAAAILFGRGLSLRADAVLNPPGPTAPADVLWGWAAVLIIIFIVLLLVAGFMALLSTSVPEHDEWESQENQDDDGHHHTHTMRRLMCPDCSTITHAEVGTVPTCQSCGFHPAS